MGQDTFILGSVLILAALAMCCLLRAILGPKLADRIMAVNMTGTLTIAMILLIAVLMEETDLLDVAMIYAVISFASVIVLTKIYIGIFRERKNARDEAQRKREETK